MATHPPPSACLSRPGIGTSAPMVFLVPLNGPESTPTLLVSPPDIGLSAPSDFSCTPTTDALGVNSHFNRHRVRRCTAPGVVSAAWRVGLSASLGWSERNGQAMSVPPTSAIGRFLSLAGLSRRPIAGIVFVFLWFLLGGIAHFALTRTEMRIVPPYIPWPHAVVLMSGVFELLGGGGVAMGQDASRGRHRPVPADPGSDAGALLHAAAAGAVQRAVLGAAAASAGAGGAAGVDRLGYCCANSAQSPIAFTPCVVQRGTRDRKRACQLSATVGL
jgi:hypothetical protein